MLWTNVLLAYDNSQTALRAVEYVGQMFSKVEGAKVTLYSIYEKVPGFDMVDTPYTQQVKGNIAALERQKEEGRMRLEEAKKHLIKMGLSEEQVTVLYVERKKGVAKQIIDKAKEGQFGTVVLGRRGEDKMLFGSVASSVISNVTGATICVVE